MALSVFILVLLISILSQPFVDMHSPFDVEQSRSCHMSSATSRTNSNRNNFKSSQRGYIAILYSGTVRTFTVTFQSHLLNLLIPSPYTVHIFVHASTGRFDLKTPAAEHDHTKLYRGFNSTIEYYNGYYNIDNEYVSLQDDVLQYVEINDNMLDMNIDKHFNYTEIFRLIGTNHDKNSIPKSVAGQLDSLRRANQARLNYERTNNIKYHWIIRLRMDHIMKTNIWEDLFSIEPLNHSSPYHRKLINKLFSESKTNFVNNSKDYNWNGGLLYDMVYMPSKFPKIFLTCYHL